MAVNFRDSRSVVDQRQPEIVSSQELPDEEVVNYRRQKRRAGAIVIVSVLSTVTSYVFNTTPVIKSYTLLNPVAPLLICLPAGYTVC